MTGGQLLRKLTMVYGDDFHREVAEVLRVDKSTVYRWINTKGKVPGAVAVWIETKIALEYLRKQIADERNAK
jgi:hypothetical protein